MIPSGAEGPAGASGFAYKLVVCPSCAGRGLVDTQPNILAKPTPGPHVCRSCRGSGATSEVIDPTKAARQ